MNRKLCIEPLSQRLVMAGFPSCNDGLDNDNDGLVDLEDSDCTSLDDDTEAAEPPPDTPPPDEPPDTPPPDDVDCVFAKYDTSDDGRVTALDALWVINQLHRDTPAVPEHLDVNNDAAITALDALQVINALNRQRGAFALSDVCSSEETPADGAENIGPAEVDSVQGGQQDISSFSVEREQFQDGTLEFALKTDNLRLSQDDFQLDVGATRHTDYHLEDTEGNKIDAPVLPEEFRVVFSDVQVPDEATTDLTLRAKITDPQHTPAASSSLETSFVLDSGVFIAGTVFKNE